MMQPFIGGASEWNSIIRHLPKSHLLQTWEWAQVKAEYGWKPMPFIWRSGTGDADPIVSPNFGTMLSEKSKTMGKTKKLRNSRTSDVTMKNNKR